MIEILFEAIGAVLSDPYTLAGIGVLIGIHLAKKEAQEKKS